MGEKKPTQDSIKLEILKCADEERKKSDQSYAVKLVERIVFSLMAAIAMAVLIALISLVIKK
jgi:lipopolysaccharide/colanic/teichoic acid biosynthesis glycosyltransferase